MGQKHDVDLPALPSSHPKSAHNIIHRDQLSRKKLQGLLHLITGELKARGTKTPHIFLPFRSRVDDSKLALFLSRVFPNGIMINTSQEIAVKTLLKEFDEFTLICGLKYLWCRLPNDEIIGWNVYLEFKRKEQEAGFPKDAFLTIMPKCLSSSSHASIVYDFLDLLISIASNSQYNHLSGRKISKMASLWAFRSSSASSRSAFYDATLVQEVSFLEGLDLWKQSCNGLFHLLLAFLRAMLPDTGAEALNLPKTLQSLLITNSYPPPEDASAMKSVITIPCVHVRSTRKSVQPFELIHKVRQNLSFDKKDSFLSIENYTILRNIFQKRSTDEIVSTLTEESRRILTRLTADAASSEYGVYPGWSKNSGGEPEDPNIPQYAEITITNVTLQDFFIWTWLSSLGSDQSQPLKAAFGRSIVVEAGLRGFQKWMVLTETTMSTEEYLEKFKGHRQEIGVAKNESPKIPPSRINAELPPPPPVSKPQNLEPLHTDMQYQEKAPPPPPEKPRIKQDTSPQEPKPRMLPVVDFGGDEFSLDSPHSFVTSPVFELRGYSAPLPAQQESNLAQNFQQLVRVKPSKNTRGPRPPPLSQISSPPSNERETRPNRPLRSPEKIISQLPHEIPEFQQYNAYMQHAEHGPYGDQGYNEPYDNYETPYDSNNQPVSSEPYDNYPVPPTKHLTPADVQKKYYQITPSPPQNTRPLDNGRAPAPQESMMHTNAGPQSSHSGHSTQKHYDIGPSSNQQSEFRADTNYPETPLDNDSRHAQSTQAPHPTHQNPQNYVYDQSDKHHESNHAYGNQVYNEERDYRDLNGQRDEVPASRMKEKEERKRKKKKRSSKLKELERMMAQFPDAPPPALPQGMANLNPPIGHGAYQNGEIPEAKQDFHQITQENIPDESTREHHTNGRGNRMIEDYPSNEALNVAPQASEESTYAPGHRHHKREKGQKQEPAYFSPPSGQEQPLQPAQNNYYQAEHHMQPVQHTQSAQRHPNMIVPPQGPSPVNFSPAPAAFGLSPKSPTNLAPVNRHPQPNQYDRVSPASPNAPVAYNPNAPPMDPQAYYTHPPNQPPQGAPHHAQYQHPEHHQMRPQIPSPNHVPTPQMAQPVMHPGQPMPQYYPGPQAHHGHYQPQMQGHYQAPPQQYYPPPPQGYGYPPQQGYGPPQGYFPPQPPRPVHAARLKAKPTTSELTMMNMPTANSFNKNTKNKAGLRAALKQGEFGI